MKSYIIFFLTLISFSTQFGSLFAQQDTIRVLHFTRTKEYDHNTRNQSRSMIEDIAAEETDSTKYYEVISDNTGSEFDDLSGYRIVIFANTTGNNGINATQRANLEAWFSSPSQGAGRKIIGIHGASDSWWHSTANGSNTGNWDWYAEHAIGVTIQRSPNHTSSNHTDSVFCDQSSAVATGIPYLTIKKEEFYYWENGYLNLSFDPWLTVGRTGSNSYDAPRMLAHSKKHTNGAESHYTSMGHSGNDYTNTDPGDNGWILKQTIRNMMTVTLPDPTPFGIIFPEASKTPEILEPGFFYLEQTPIVPLYEVADMAGRIVQKGIIEGNRVPVMKQSGLWMYRVYGRVWVAGVVNN